MYHSLQCSHDPAEQVVLRTDATIQDTDVTTTTSDRKKWMHLPYGKPSKVVPSHYHRLAKLGSYGEATPKKHH